MRILALDLATKTGWAHTNGQSGMQSFEPRRGDSHGMRFLEFRAWMGRMLELAPYDLIVFEQVVGGFKSGAAARVLHGLAAETEAFAAEHKIQITSRSPSELKKGILGEKKKANKERMIMYVENHWPHVELESDDQADAILLLWLTMYGLRVTGTPWHERYVL